MWFFIKTLYKGPLMVVIRLLLIDREIGFFYSQGTIKIQGEKE